MRTLSDSKSGEADRTSANLINDLKLLPEAGRARLIKRLEEGELMGVLNTLLDKEVKVEKLEKALRPGNAKGETKPDSTITKSTSPVHHIAG